MKFFPLIIIIFFSCSKGEISKSRVRVVSLAPSLTEIVFALRRGDDLLGVTTFCNYPAQAAKKYKVGDFSNPSLERIVTVKPDIVLVTIPEQTRIKNELEKLKIKTYNSSPATIGDIFKDIMTIGQILNASDRADSLIDSLRDELARVTQILVTDTPKVYLEISPQPLVSVGSSSYINEMICLAGGKNIFGDLGVDYPVISQEELLKRNPDIIFILHDARVGQRLGWKEIGAVRNNRIYYDLEPDLVFRPGPRVIKGIKMMHERMKELR